jgi:hypothetical protein
VLLDQTLQLSDPRGVVVALVLGERHGASEVTGQGWRELKTFQLLLNIMQNSKIALIQGTFPLQITLCDSDGVLPTMEFMKKLNESETNDDFCSRIARRQLTDAMKRSTYSKTFNMFSTRLSALEVACIVHDGNEDCLTWRRFPRDTYETYVLAMLSLPRLLGMFACAATVWSVWYVAY